MTGPDAAVTATEEAAAEAAWQAWRMSQGVMPGEWSVLGYEAKEDWRAAARAARSLIVAEIVKRLRTMEQVWDARGYLRHAAELLADENGDRP